MTAVTIGLFVGLALATAALVRRDIRKAVRRRQLRAQRRAEISRAVVALQGMASNVAALAPAFERAADSLYRFTAAFKLEAAARTSPFPPSRTQKGRAVR